jgi:hypothetical protein
MQMYNIMNTLYWFWELCRRNMYKTDVKRTLKSVLNIDKPHKRRRGKVKVKVK